MNSISSVASNFGAGVSQGRIQGIVEVAHLKDQEQPSSGDLGAAALQLIRSAAVSAAGSTVHNLDVLA
jgi:hypothetical protein